MINLWSLFARRSKSLDLFTHAYDIAGQYRRVAQEEFDTVVQDPTFHERIRGSPSTVTSTPSGAPLHPSSSPSNIFAVYERIRGLYSWSHPGRIHRPLPRKLRFHHRRTQSHPSFPVLLWATPPATLASFWPCCMRTRFWGISESSTCFVASRLRRYFHSFPYHTPA